MATVKKPRAVPSAEFDGRPLAPSRPGTVLVLDDEPLMLSACERILRNAGHRVIPVDNAPGALQVVGEEASRAIHLHVFEGYKYAEVGKELGKSEDAAKMQIHRALKELRRHLEDGDA